MVLSEQFRALMADERESFMQMIWPIARSIVVAAEWGMDFPKAADDFKAAVVATRKPALKAVGDTPLKALTRASKKAVAA